MIGVVYLTLLLMSGLIAPGMGTPAGLFHPELLAGVAVGMLFLIGTGTLVRTLQLRRGGPAVAALLGGREIEPTTSDPAERRLFNIVEEMSLASGTPVPAVFVLDRETAINAFAAGHTIHDAAVAVTRGTLDRLSRDELQGVIAHEFSHILSGDMRLNLRLAGLLFGILLLTVVGRGVLRGSYFTGRGGGGRRKGGGQIALLGFVLILLGYLGVFFGRLIQAAVSRQREFLADAAAVQFTRNPDGIAGALRKIGGVAEGSEIQDHHAQEVGHLFFADGLKRGFAGMLATHPPLDERVRRILGGDAAVARDTAAGAPAGMRGGGGPMTAAHAGFAPVASIGNPAAEHLTYARRLLSDLPPELREATRDPEDALALTLGLLLPGDAAAEARRSEIVAQELGPELAKRVEHLARTATLLGPEGRLPLLDLCLPALRRLAPERSRRLRAVSSRLIRADGRVAAFEFALFHVLRRNLEEAAGEGRARRPRAPGPDQRLHREMEIVLSALARSGDGDEEAQRQAFAAGAALLPGGPGDWALHPEASVTLDQVDGSLDRLEAAPAGLRRRLLEAALRTVRADGRLDPEELELLRAVSESLDAPMPPALPTESTNEDSV